MTLAVLGSGLLAQTTATCCAEHFTVHRTSDANADAYWLCHDTPILPSGGPDVAAVMELIQADLAWVAPGKLIIISSQIPVGTTARLEAMYPELDFVYVPENIRRATAEADFRHQSRVVVGTRSDKHNAFIETLFTRFTNRYLYMSPESAEMSKTVLNAFLALNINFGHEVAAICKSVGATTSEVCEAVLHDRRVSSHAPLNPTGSIGPHLNREVFTLNALAKEHGVAVPLIGAIAK
jgi:UDPglucose 6-dehydrogenase